MDVKYDFATVTSAIIGGMLLGAAATDFSFLNFGLSPAWVFLIGGVVAISATIRMMRVEARQQIKTDGVKNEKNI